MSHFLFFFQSCFVDIPQPKQSFVQTCGAGFMSFCIGFVASHYLRELTHYPLQYIPFLKNMISKCVQKLESLRIWTSEDKQLARIFLGSDVEEKALEENDEMNMEQLAQNKSKSIMHN